MYASTSEQEAEAPRVKVTADSSLKQMSSSAQFGGTTAIKPKPDTELTTDRTRIPQNGGLASDLTTQSHDSRKAGEDQETEKEGEDKGIEEERERTEGNACIKLGFDKAADEEIENDANEDWYVGKSVEDGSHEADSLKDVIKDIGCPAMY